MSNTNHPVVARTIVGQDFDSYCQDSAKVLLTQSGSQSRV